MTGRFAVRVLAAPLLLATHSGCRQHARKGPVPPRHGERPAIAVDVAAVATKTLREVRMFTGSLAAKTEVIVAPNVGGRLEQLFVDLGDAVRRHQLLAVLDSTEYLHEVEQARAERKLAVANLAAAESERDLAWKEWERARRLYDQGIVSQAEEDEAEAKARMAEARHQLAQAQVEQKTAALKTAEVRLSYTRIPADWEGGAEERFVAERYAEPGNLLRATDPIVSLVEVDVLRAVIHVPQTDSGRIRIGQQVAVTTESWPGLTFPGTVTRVAPVLQEASRTVRVEVEVPNPDRRLKPGMFIRAEIDLGRREDVTVVPTAALTRRNGRQGIFVVDRTRGVARFVPVELGLEVGDEVEIVRPPLEGTVVTLGHHLLEEEAPIRLPEAPVAALPAAQCPESRRVSPSRDRP